MSALYVILPLSSLCMSTLCYQPTSFTGTVGVYRSIYLMASLRSQGQNDPHCADGDTREALRGTWLVQGHITDEKEDPSLKPAVSSELGTWLHPGLPTAVGWGVLVSLHMHMIWGGGE